MLSVEEGEGATELRFNENIEALKSESKQLFEASKIDIMSGSG